jgi:mono/diheme cytochrome c family protein
MWIQKPLLHGWLLALAALSCSCSKDPNQTKLTYMPDMADGPVAKPQRNYLDPPVGSVAMNAILYPKDVEAAGQLLLNPFAETKDLEKVRREGKHLYSQVCTTCHGADAKGKGTISDVYPPGADLTSEMYRQKSDGFLFHRITFGSAIMPFQGDKLDPMERWKVVMYVRQLQEEEHAKELGKKG